MRNALSLARVSGHSFLTAPISRESVVVDLGVNHGEFALAMIERFGCTVVGLEPVPALYAALPAHERLDVAPLAITCDGRAATLYVNPTRCATIETGLSQSGALAVEVEGVTLEGLLDSKGIERTSLVKVDIEGAEIAMLETASLATLGRIDQLTIEFHDFLDPGLGEAVARVKGRLRRAGFVELALSRDNSDVLFVNRARVSFGTTRRGAVAMTQKYPRGLARMARRSLGRARGAARRRPPGR